MNLRVLIGSLALFACLSASASAATLNVVGGQLVGASGVDVLGSLYNVEFVDGTCIDLFTGCDDPSDFTFNTQAQATLASEALLDQVFLDGTYNFDSEPALTSGCYAPDDCYAETVFATDGTDWSSISADNSVVEIVDGLVLYYGALPTDMTGNPYEVFARWTPVPEPSTASLLALGLVGIAAIRRRRGAA
jgi:hypothetical protein